MVIQAPAHVLGIRLTPVAPPGVGRVRGGRLEAAVNVDHLPVFQQLGHPVALLREKAAVLLVAAPVLQVNLLVGDIHIAAQDEFALRPQTGQVGMKRFQKPEFGRLPLRPGGSAGKIGADNRQLARGRVEPAFQIPSLGVEFGGAESRDDITGFMPAEDADARVPLFLGKVEVSPQSGKCFKTAPDIVRLGLDFLHANTIGPMDCQPGLHPLGGGRPDPVEVEAGELEQGTSHGG